MFFDKDTYFNRINISFAHISKGVTRFYVHFEAMRDYLLTSQSQSICLPFAGTPHHDTASVSQHEKIQC
jgi:hypothetical protein